MPIEINESVEADPRALAREPVLATRIAVILSAWGEIEEDLTFLFIRVMNTTPAIAASVLQNVFSVQTKIEMIRTALKMRFKEAAVAPFAGLADELKKRARERNRVAHAMWTVHKSHPGALIRLSGITDPQLRMEKYDLNDFAQIELRLLQTSIALRQFSLTLTASQELTDEEQREAFWRMKPPTERIEGD